MQSATHATKINLTLYCCTFSVSLRSVQSACWETLDSDQLDAIRAHLDLQHALGSDRFHISIERLLNRCAGPARIVRPGKSTTDLENSTSPGFRTPSRCRSRLSPLAFQRFLQRIKPCVLRSERCPQACVLRFQFLHLAHRHGFKAAQRQ